MSVASLKHRPVQALHTNDHLGATRSNAFDRRGPREATCRRGKESADHIGSSRSLAEPRGGLPFAWCRTRATSCLTLRSFPQQQAAVHRILRRHSKKRWGEATSLRLYPKKGPTDTTTLRHDRRKDVRSHRIVRAVPMQCGSDRSSSVANARNGDADNADTLDRSDVSDTRRARSRSRRAEPRLGRGETMGLAYTRESRLWITLYRTSLPWVRSADTSASSDIRRYRRADT